MKTIQRIPVWLFPPTCIFRQTGFAQGPIHPQCSTLAGKAGQDRAVEVPWWQGCMHGACLGAPLLWGPTAGALWFFLHGKVPCRHLSALLDAMGQSSLWKWENPTSGPSAIGPTAQERSLPGGREGLACQHGAACKPGGYGVPYAKGFWVITRSPGHAACWKCN